MISLIAWARETMNMNLAGTDWRTPAHPDVVENILATIGLYEVYTRSGNKWVQAVTRYQKLLSKQKSIRGRVGESVEKAISPSDAGEADEGAEHD